MSTVMIKCPDTGVPVSTGIEIEQDTFAKLPNLSSGMSCPACGNHHFWHKTDAWLSNAAAPHEPKKPA
jgi:hypothetical protein